MVDLDYLVDSLARRLDLLDSRAGAVGVGRGASLKTLVTSAAGKLRAESELVVAGAGRDADDPAALSSASRTLERLITKAEIFYVLLATYSDDVGRVDIPVGLQNLVDQLVEDLLDGTADPLIHLHAEDNYSTGDLGQALSAPPGTKRPVAFHLPKFDPANALLSPILAHEVGHTLWASSGVSGAFIRALELGGAWASITESLDELGGQSAIGLSDWDERFYAWAEELYCDGLAAALTGPSYLLAIAAFLVVPNTAPGDDSHPPDRLRGRFILRVLKHMGWEPFLESELGPQYEWFTGLADDLPAQPAPHGDFLVHAVERAFSELVGIAVTAVKHPLSPEAVTPSLGEAIALINLGTPPITQRPDMLSTWGLVLAGWMSIVGGTTAPTEINRAATDPGLNALVIKSLELSRIVELWESS